VDEGIPTAQSSWLLIGIVGVFGAQLYDIVEIEACMEWRYGIDVDHEGIQWHMVPDLFKSC
jgi:hypothetical protein